MHKIKFAFICVVTFLLQDDVQIRKKELYKTLVHKLRFIVTQSKVHIKIIPFI